MPADIKALRPLRPAVFLDRDGTIIVECDYLADPDRVVLVPGATAAMRELAASGARRPIGCTQSTEIISTKGVTLSGSLPQGCELATMYTAGITARAAHVAQARNLIDLLTGAGQHEQRERAGFISRPN